MFIKPALVLHLYMPAVPTIIIICYMDSDNIARNNRFDQSSSRK